MRTNEKRIEKIEKEIFDETTLEGLKAFINSVKIVTTLVNKIKDRKQDYNVYFTRKDLSNKLGISLKNLQISQFPDSSEEHILYCLYHLEIQGKAKKLIDSPCIFRNNKLIFSWDFEKIISVLGDKIKFNNYPMIINTGCAKYIVCYTKIIQPDRKDKSAYLILSHKDKSIECFEHFENAVKDNTILKKGIVIVSNSGISVKRLSTKLSLSQVSLAPEIHQETSLIVNMFKNYQNYVDKGIQFKRNILLYSNPGLGKTSTINAIAQEAMLAGATVFSFESTNQYSVEQDLRTTYQLAQDNAPSLLIIEDFDLIAKNRDTNNNTVSNDLLQILSGSVEYRGIISIFSTNRLHDLDRACVRAGRIDKGYPIDYPDKKMKRQIISSHLVSKKLLIPLSETCKSMSKLIDDPQTTGAEIDSVLTSAIQIATSKNEQVNQKHIAWGCASYNRLEYIESKVKGFA